MEFDALSLSFPPSRDDGYVNNLEHYSLYVFKAFFSIYPHSTVLGGSI